MDLVEHLYKHNSTVFGKGGEVGLLLGTQRRHCSVLTWTVCEGGAKSATQHELCICLQDVNQLLYA